MGSRDFEYDDNGSIIRESKDGADRRRLTWGAHGKVERIWQSNLSKVDGLDGTSLYDQAFTEIKFDYDGGTSRIRQTMERNTSSVGTFTGIKDLVTTDYLGSYERIKHQVKRGGSLQLDRIEHRHTIGGFAIKTFTQTSEQAQPTEKIVYQLKDHLGSVSALVDHLGALIFKNGVEQVFSYDSWGQRRDAQTWLAYSDSGGTQRTSRETNRGFTGHEMLDEVGLVHMNGRIYDSEVGRFLSGDPHVQAPENSQNYNRYAYVLNNPLSYTDPSGYFFKKLFKAIGKIFKAILKVLVLGVIGLFKNTFKWIKENWRSIVSIAVAVIAAFAFVPMAWAPGSGTLFSLKGAAFGKITGGALAGAVSGGVNAAINGGGFEDILRGAIVGAIQGALTAGLGDHFKGLARAGELGVGEKALWVAGHGVIGGGASAALGGKFKDGFLSAAVSKAFNVSTNDSPTSIFNDSGAAGVISRTLRSAVIGGTASAISGGKFANGAWTAAFQHLLNEERKFIEQKKNDLVFEMKLNGKKRTLLTQIIKNPDGSITRISVPAFSGGGKHINNPNSQDVPNLGPIPKGSYYIVDRPKGGTLGFIRGFRKRNWFALFANDRFVDDHTSVNGVVRSNIRLHPGTISEGCVTCIHERNFNNIRQRLLNSGTNLIPGRNIPYYGTLTVK